MIKEIKTMQVALTKLLEQHKCLVVLMRDLLLPSLCSISRFPIFRE